MSFAPLEVSERHVERTQRGRETSVAPLLCHIDRHAVAMHFVGRRPSTVKAKRFRYLCHGQGFGFVVSSAPVVPPQTKRR